MVAVLYALAIFAYIAQSIALKIQPGCSGEEDQDIISDGDAYTFYATFIGAPSNNASNPFANVTLILPCRKTSAPEQNNEPSHSLSSLLAPLPRGACIIRDARLWHGGTPNYSADHRYLPNLEFFSSEYTHYVEMASDNNRFSKKTMPQSVFLCLSDRAKKVARDVVLWGEDTVSRGIKLNVVHPQGSAYRKIVNDQLSALKVGETTKITGNGYEWRQVRLISEDLDYDFHMVKEGRFCTAYVTRTH